MADQFITDLDAITTAADTDLMVFEVNPGGTPETNKMTVANVKALLKAYNDTLYSTVTGPTYYNNLINGGFDFAQRQTPGTLTTITTDTLSADRWRLSRENADAQYQRVDATGETGLTSKFYGSFKKITNTGKMHIVQILTSGASVPLRSKTVIFQARMKASSTKTIRMAVIELQAAGTIDTIPATFCAAWGANGVDPTLGANLAVITGAQSKTVTTSWQNFSVSVTVPSTSKNLICAIWTDSQFAANDILNIAEAGLYVGATAQDWKPRHMTEEILLCQRHCWKSFELDTAPANNGSTVNTHRTGALTAGATTQRFTPIIFPVTMFKTPTATYYNPSAGTAGQARDVTAGADCSATTSAALTTTLLDINCTGNAGTAVGNSILVGVMVEAELVG